MATSTEQPTKKSEGVKIFACTPEQALKAYEDLMTELGYTPETQKLKRPTFEKFVEKHFPGFSVRPKKSDKPAKETKQEKPSKESAPKKDSKKPTKSK